ncbi:glutathione S-transferase C-terminal domain-containing protein [Ponticaulis sp.]|uniref:glutathione S-transferase C-terminal domain-containing protein n=1 Tax=Ponticaulis sp. TaxID=2020902 RepID=UPI000C635B32|nr:glutathione S-transferase C-terminal domain-containing protein [Ponticaulis sp.]MBN05243.1 glutathione S-transferase [Ponticaulis sp.]
MITLYGWGPMFDCPSPSSFVMKSLIQLQMLGVEFDLAVADLEAVPKMKAPYLVDDGTLVEDTNFIRWHLENKLGRSLDDGLSAAEAAAGWALERMAEDHVVKNIITQRWMRDENFQKGPALFFMGIPEPQRTAVTEEVRGGMRAYMHGQGFGRHSETEQLELADRDITAIANFLGDKDYLFGDAPAAADAGVAAVLIAAACEFFETPLSGLVRRHENLVAYITRMEARYLTGHDWPVPEMA